MSDPGPSSPTPMEEQPDYALSDSSAEDGYDGSGSDVDKTPAFKGLPLLGPITTDATLGLASVTKSPPSGIVQVESTYYQVIPEWTRVDGPQELYRRPAILPGDNPSIFAQRFGIDNDAPRGSPRRSMLTPISDAYGDSTQVPDWVEDWQSFTFGGYTADELKAQGVFDPDMKFADPANDSLQDDIHPLLEREKWRQPNYEGIEQFPILVYCIDDHSGGKRNYDCYDLNPGAENEVLWNAMQPALRLASKVLKSKPPYWEALLDLYNRQPVDSRIVSEPLEEGTSLTSIWLDVVKARMYPEASELQELEFDAKGYTNHVLTKLIRLSFENFDNNQQYKGYSGGTSIIVEQGVYDDKKYLINVRIAPQLVWPLLVPEYSAAEKTAVSMHIANTLLHELGHAVIAAQNIMMTHEDWNQWQEIGDDEDLGIFPNVLSQRELDLLLALGRRINGKGGYEPSPRYFFQDEPQAEEGYAFENMLWGGELAYLPAEHGMDKSQGFPSSITVTMKSWPRAKHLPRPEVAKSGSKPKDNWPEWITEPPSTMVERETALPVAMYGRFFHQGFWGQGGPFEQYGQQALKLPTHQWGPLELKSQFRYFYLRKIDVAKAFGSRRVYRWMLAATEILQRARQYVIADYMLDLTESVVQADMMGKRLHYEKKIWPRTDTKISGQIQEIKRLQCQFPDILRKYKQAKVGSSGPNGSRWEKAVGAYIDQASLILTRASEVQRLLGIEVQYLQYVVLGVLRQDVETRRKLRKYTDIISYRSQDFLMRMADVAIGAATHIHEQYLLEIVPDLPQQLNKNLRRLTDKLDTISRDVQSTFPSTRQQISNLADIITRYNSNDDSEEPAPSSLQGINLLVDASGLREIRTKQRQLQGLALRDMRRLRQRRQAPETRLLDAWLRALQAQPRLAEATVKERRLMRTDIISWLAEVDLGA